jgi:hypothetical protein
MVTLRSILNVGYVVGMKGRRERQALCCAVDVPLNFNLYGQRLAGVGVTVVAGVLLLCRASCPIVTPTTFSKTNMHDLRRLTWVYLAAMILEQTATFNFTWFVAQERNFQWVGRNHTLTGRVIWLSVIIGGRGYGLVGGSVIGSLWSQRRELPLQSLVRLMCSGDRGAESLGVGTRETVIFIDCLSFAGEQMSSAWI